MCGCEHWVLITSVCDGKYLASKVWLQMSNVNYRWRHEKSGEMWKKCQEIMKKDEKKNLNGNRSEVCIVYVGEMKLERNWIDLLYIPSDVCLKKKAKMYIFAWIQSARLTHRYIEMDIFILNTYSTYFVPVCRGELACGVL